MRLRRGRQEGLRGRPPGGQRPQGPRKNAGRRGGGLHGRAVRQGAGRGPARGRRRPRLRRLRRHLRPPADHPQRRHPRRPHPARPAQAAADQPRRAPRGRCLRRPARARAGRPPRGRRARLRPPRSAPSPPGRCAGRLREAGLRLRPALLLLRHPVLPRLLHLAPPQRRAERDAVAGRAGRQGDHAGLREQHLLRQGPRRHPPAGVPAAEPGRGRRHRAGAGQLPPAGRDAPRSDRRPDLHAQGRALLRPLLPALRAERAARDAPLRRHRPLPGAAGHHPEQGARGRRALQLHRGLPRRERLRPRRAGAVPEPRAAGRHRRLRLLRRGGHRGGDLRRQAGRGRRRRAAGTGLPPRRGTGLTARRGARGRHRAGPRGVRGVRRLRRRGDGVRGRAEHQAPETDGQVLLTSGEGLRVGSMVEAKVVGTEGVDLVAEPLPVSPAWSEEAGR